MADTTPTPPAADLAVLLNVVAEQTRMIQLLQERVGALEGQTPSPRASAVASPVSPPNDTSTIVNETSDEDVESPNTSVEPENSERALSDDSVIRQVEGTTEKHPASATPTVPDQAREVSPGDELAPVSTASQPTSLRPEAQPFLPSFLPPPSGDPPGPHPENSFQPTSWGVPAHDPAATGHAQDSLSPVHDAPTDTNNHTQTDDEPGTQPVEDSTATAMNEWAQVASDGWGEPIGDTVQAPSSNSVAAKPIEGPKLTKKRKARGARKSGGKSPQSDCRFDHPSPKNSEVQSDTRSNSAHSSTSNASTRNAKPGPSQPSKQAGSNDKPACKYAGNCSRKNCPSAHPPGWSAKKSRARPVPAQQTSTWGDRSDNTNWNTPSDDNAQTAVNNSWDTECQDGTTVEANNDWGAWNVAPNNDWATPANNDWATPANNDWANPTNELEPPATATPVAQPRTPVPEQKKALEGQECKTELQKPEKGHERERSATPKENATLSVQPPYAQSIPVVQPENEDDCFSMANKPAASNDIANSADATSIDAISIDTTPVEAPLPADLLLDVLGTPNLEPASSPTTSSSLSELDVPATPFSWADEPLDDAISPSQPNKNQANPDKISPSQLNKNKANLDKTAPSCMYSSWAQSETSDWGNMTADPTDDTNNAGIGAAPAPAGQETQTEGFGWKQGAKNKGKGKQKETGQGKPTAVSSPNKKDSSTRIPGPSNASTSTTAQQVAQTSKPESTPVHRPEPQGVPDADVASWLLGEGEDDHAVLGLSPNPTPKPVTIPVRPPSPRPGPSQPRLNKTPGGHFPPLVPSSNYKPPATSVASGPTIRPMQTGFKIISIGGTPTAQAVQPAATKASNKGPVLNSRRKTVPKKQIWTALK